VITWNFFELAAAFTRDAVQHSDFVNKGPETSGLRADGRTHP
jgi:hypothetical protein